MKTQITRGIAALGLALTIGACADSLGLNAAGNLAMTLQRMDEPLTPAPQGSPSQGRSVEPDSVESFKITVTSVMMLHAASDSNAGTWSTVQLDAPVTIDLAALPTESQAAFTFASGQVEAGTYSRVRLVVANPEIRFKGDVSFGLGGTLQGGVDYDVQLVGASSGLEAAASVEVQSSGSSSTVHLVFNQSSSLGSVSIGGTGMVLLTAVIEER